MRWIVSDVMTKDPVTVGRSTSFKACANLMRIHEVSAIPVVDRGARLVGIVSEFDLLAKQAQGMVRSRPQPQGGKSKAIKAAELMTASLVTTTAGAPLATAASLMFQHHLKVLPVVDAEQRLVGTVSRAQVLKVFLRSDESIRREVVQSLCGKPSMNRLVSEVEVKDGVVHLYFADQEGSLAEVIGRRVMGIPGVVGVKSHSRQSTDFAAAGMGPDGESPRQAERAEEDTRAPSSPDRKITTPDKMAIQTVLSMKSPTSPPGHGLPERSSEIST